MGLFNLSDTTNLKEGGNFLTAGIHNAKFKGIALGSVTSQAKGITYNTMALTLDVDGYGEWTHNFFDPTKTNGVDDPNCTVRTQSQYGVNPSRVDNFMVALRQIFDALDPKIGEMIDNKNIVVNGKQVSTDFSNFESIVKFAAFITKDYVGKEVEIKLIPTNTGFNDFPGYPARINRAGALGVATRFIGQNLALSQSEQRKIENAANNRPTNMAASAELNGVADVLGIGDDSPSDLPF